MPNQSFPFDAPILVTGATGTQGGATARKLLAAGQRVRILTRNPASANALRLAALGADIAQGDMEDPASLSAAMQGAYGVFSVQRPDPTGKDAERRHANALIAAARQAGVRHFVHTSVCEAGKHESFPRWETGYWGRNYWTDKWDVEEAVRQAGFPLWTVLKPAFMMENYAPPKVQNMFPHLREGRIVSAMLPDTRLQLIAGDDVGAFAQAAFAAPERFHGHNIDLAVEALTMAEVAAILNRQLGTTVRVESVSPAEAKAAGLFPGWVRTQEWVNEVGYRADIDALKKTYGMALTPFADWVQQHASEIVITPAA